MNAHGERRPRSTRVASHTPGRLRIKLHPKSWQMYAMRHIKDNLEAKEGIYGVKLNQSAGSVTVNYDHQRYGVSGIFQALEDVDVIFADLTGEGSLEESPPKGDEAPLDLIGAIDDLSNRLSNFAGTRIDLKSILPLAFFGAGLWSFARGGLMIEKIPGWLFLWLGFDTFVKLHGDRSGSGLQPPSPEAPPRRLKEGP